MRRIDSVQLFQPTEQKHKQMTSIVVVDADCGTSEVPCDQCGKIFADSYALKMHLCRGGGNGLVVQNLPINIPMARDLGDKVQNPVNGVYASSDHPKKRVRQLPEDDDNQHVNDAIPDPNEVDRNKVRRNGYREKCSSSTYVLQSSRFDQYTQLTRDTLAAQQNVEKQRHASIDADCSLKNTKMARVQELETRFGPLAVLKKLISEIDK